METNTRTNITAPVIAYFDKVGSNAVDLDAYRNEWGSLVTTYDFPAVAAEGYDIVRVELNPEDESVRIIGFTNRYVIDFDLRVEMGAPLVVIRAAFLAACGYDA